MENEDKSMVEYTMGIGKINLIAVVLIFPITAVLLIPFILIWDYSVYERGQQIFMHYFLVILLAGVVVHELLHGITWGYYAKRGMRSIKFGIKWKYLTPYCHCKEPLKAKHYRIGGIMPLLIMGILPSVVAYVTGNGVFLSFGIFFSWAAGGDIIALFMLRKFDRNIFISDHPKKMGFYIEVQQNN